MPELPVGEIILTGQCDAGTRRDVYSRHNRGDLIRVRQGTYVASDAWERLDAAERHRALVLAVTVDHDEDLVFSHLTAAALWRLPVVGPLPRNPQTLGTGASGGRSTKSLERSQISLPREVVDLENVHVTSLCSTTVDVAATCGFATAVAIADAALRRTLHPLAGVPSSSLTRDQLQEHLDRLSPFYGSVKARRAIDFADALADGPGESLSRVSIHLSRLSKPELQVPLLGASGTKYFVDFWWPQFRVIGEFDGKHKYTDPQLLRGRTPAEVVYAEKLREDDLRARGYTVSRWPWSTAMTPALLRQQLRRAGVR
jgi:hypothetical protein